LADQKKRAEAAEAYRKAITLKPDYAKAYTNLGRALREQKHLPEAEAAYRKAVELQPDFAQAYYNLGSALGVQKKLPEAVEAYRKAIALQPDHAEAHCNLGHIFRVQGHFANALTALKQGHELGSRNPRWPYPSAQWVRQAERLVELDAKLPAILKGEAKPASSGERLDLAAICTIKQLHASAACLYQEAIAAKPDVVASPGNGHRYNAACAAALAGCGVGEDAAKLTDAERAGLRKQALGWLRADRESWARFLDQEPDKARPVVAQTMQHWLRDPDFNGMRGPDALGKLSEAERKEWQKLWADVANTLAKARGKTAPEQRPGVK
jgi:tetratricopeptide (TPR) repeat protein